jgi:hypothetical protein
MLARRLGLTTVVFAFVALVASMAPALADVQSIYHGGLYFGSVLVEPGQIVRGDLTVIGGDATIEGVVDGNVTVIGGTPYEGPGAIVTGHVDTIGGGDVAGAVAPWSGPMFYPHGWSGDYRVFWHVAWDLVVILFFLVFPLRTRMALDRLERHPGLCAAVGLIGWIAVLPLALLLLVTILLIPLIAVEGVLLVGAVFLGKAALALLVGRRLCEVMSPSTTPTPFIALIVGLALITAAELVPLIGMLVSVFVLLIGLGAAILAFAGDSLTGRPVAATPRPPISGPPMPAA